MSTSTLRIELVQANAHVGAIEANLAFALRRLETTQADLLVFPECFLTGYPLQDLVMRPGFLAEVDEALDRLATAVRLRGGPGVLMGAPLAGTVLPYNAAHLIRPDGSRQVTLKTELPNNDVFDERRTFARGQSPAPLDFGDWRLGVMVCEDMWHGPVARALADEGADVLLVINGSPMEIGKQDIRLAHARRRVQATGLPLMYLNLIGGQDELVFDGASFVLSEAGTLLAQRPFQAGSVEVLLERNNGVCTAQALGNRTLEGEDQSLVMAYPDEDESIYRTLCLGLRDYVDKNGFETVLLGLSGGLDSALVAALAADALGAQRVAALMLPAQWTGDESRGLAETMAERLGCHYGSVAIGESVLAIESMLDKALPLVPHTDNERHQAARKVAAENVQARVRGNLLMALSNALPGTLVLSTGNKSEMSVGYATLYGDMCGGFNPIKDLYKTLVFRLCHWRNAHQLEWMKGPATPIPERIIERPPTAELAEGQTDEKSLGAYPQLDAVLSCLIERMLSPEAAAREASRVLGSHIEPDYAVRIAGLVQRAEYKRRQAPPGIKLTARSFGFGWRYPITNAAHL